MKAILRRILGHDGHSQNDGDVVLGLLGQDVSVVEFPEVGIAGALDGGLHRARTGVVSGHREIPVTELVIEIFEMPGGGAGGLLGILAVVHIHVVVHTIAPGAAAHELPDAAGAYARDGQGMKSGFGLRQINQILRDAFFFQDWQHHLAIPAGAGQGTLEDAASVVGEVGNEPGDLVGHHEREVGPGVLDVRFGFGFGTGIGRRTEFVGLIDGRWFRLLLGLLSLSLFHIGGGAAGV